jgi:dihydroorotase (multifunctional complex type)
MPSPIDLVLHGARVMTPEGMVRADVLVRDGRILGLEDDATGRSAIETIDVSGQVLLPGLIDSHAHLRQPGHEHKEDIEHGTRAAAAGGYTTVIGMPNVNPVTSDVERYRAAIALYEASSCVDFNHFPTGTDVAAVPGLAAAGALGYKIYMIGDAGRDYLRQPGLGVTDHGVLYDIADAIAATGLPMLVHPHDQALMRSIEARFHARGERDHRAYARAYAMHGGMVWDTAAAFQLRLQEATGVRLHLLHMKTRRMIELVRTARARGQVFTTEVNPVSMLLAHDWRNIEQVGPYALSTYIGDDEAEPLWEAFLDGTLDVVGPDHAPHTREEKEVGWTDMWKAAGGLPHLQETLPLFLTEVAAGRLTLERLVEATSSTPARVFGIDDRKGGIVVGRDADMVAVDLDAEATLHNEDMLSKCGWTAFDGRSVRGLPRLTLVRGVPVFRDGRVVGAPGSGRVVRPRPDRDRLPS